MIALRPPRVALAAGLALLAACGAEPPPPAEPSELEVRAAAPDAPEPRPIDPATVGAVRGVVRLAGAAPERREIPLVRECRVHAEPLLSEDVVVGPDGGLRDVLVHVRRGLAAWEVPPPPEGPPPHLDQLGCRYVPHVLALRAGRTLEVRNSDQLTHNVRVRAPRNGLDLNRSQAEGGAPIELPFERAELGVRVGCDLHPWMGAVVHVLDHPFHAVTGPDGAFAIEGLPPGEYELEARHPTLGRQRATVRVERGADAALDLTFAVD